MLGRQADSRAHLIVWPKQEALGSVREPVSKKGWMGGRKERKKKGKGGERGRGGEATHKYIDTLTDSNFLDSKGYNNSP